MLAGRLAFRYAFRPPLSSECRSMSTQYDANNVFAKILRGEIPSHRLYEDEATFAFMDIMPRGQGHCLVIPKKPARNILDVEPDSLAAVAATAQKLARAVVKAFSRRWRDHPAVQRIRRRPGRFPPACPCPAAFQGRGAESARRPDGAAGGSGSQRRKDQGGAGLNRLRNLPAGPIARPEIGSSSPYQPAASPAPSITSPTMMPTSMRLPDSR